MEKYGWKEVQSKLLRRKEATATSKMVFSPYFILKMLFQKIKKAQQKFFTKCWFWTIFGKFSADLGTKCRKFRYFSVFSPSFGMCFEHFVGHIQNMAPPSKLTVRSLHWTPFFSTGGLFRGALPIWGHPKINGCWPTIQKNAKFNHDGEKNIGCVSFGFTKIVRKCHFHHF